MEMKNWFDCWLDESIERKKIDVKRICQFGVKALDDAFIGILPNDFIVIGADSGVGKSEFCLNMAISNARNGKKVALYFIEGGAEEAIARIKWQAIKSKYYAKGCSGVTIDYRKWRMNCLNSKIIDELEEECCAELYRDCKDRLQIYSFEEGFQVTNLINSLGYFSKTRIEYGMMVNDGLDIDMIIVDHLQYFTITNERAECQEITEILKKLKDITNFHKIPVVLVSHLRKKEKDRGLAGQEDFHGSSNIAKISSISITISAMPEKEDYGREIYPTAFRVVKSRTGIRSSYAIVCNFDYKKQSYMKEYEVWKLKGNFPDCILNEENLPTWAQKQDRFQRKEVQTHV